MGFTATWGPAVALVGVLGGCDAEAPDPTENGEPDPIPAADDSGVEPDDRSDDGVASTTSTTGDEDPTGDDADEDDEEGSGTSGAPVEPTVFFEADIWPLLNNRCADGACHQNGNTAYGLSLDHDGCYDRISGAEAMQSPGMDFIEPGNADESYFFLKIAGTHADVGAGLPMPPEGDGYSAQELAIFRQWIEEGAYP